MICTREKGHEGQCIAGDTSGGCKKTAAKWFASEEPEVWIRQETTVTEGDYVLPAFETTTVGEPGVGLQVDQEDRLVEVWLPIPGGVMAVPGDEWPTIDEPTLVRYYRQTVVPPRERKEAIEWAREQLAERDSE